MTLEKIDQLLAEWKQKIDLVSQNLLDLQSLPTYQKLTGELGFPKVKLRGMTEARVTPALAAMNDLFQHFDLLLVTVERATELRKQVPRFLGSEQKCREIEQILTGPSIQLSVVSTPLAQRGLLSAAETTQAIAPKQLLEVMMEAFQVARDAVLAVDEAWLQLEPAIASAQTEITSLQKLADSLGQGTLSELVLTEKKITSLRQLIESDPLSAKADFAREIQPLILRVKTTLSVLVQQRNQIQNDLVTAHQLLNQLIELHRQAEIAFAESQEKVVDHSMLKTPLKPEQIDALSQWLARLEIKFSEGLLNPVRVGLENWTLKARESVATEEKAYAANQAPLDMRMELRGRLEALQAKALGRGLAEDAILSELAEAAKKLLYSRPTPLEQAADLITQYEKRLNRQNS
ncbi:MAG: hypothetical protein ACM37W_02590 [Actinomycetota bacterium]